MLTKTKSLRRVFKKRKLGIVVAENVENYSYLPVLYTETAQVMEH